MSNELAEQTLEHSIEILLKHCKNKKRFSIENNQILVGGENCFDYTKKSLRRTRASQKKYNHSIFINSAAAGSNFYHCTFNNCRFINANFQECSFGNSQIVNNIKDDAIVHCNFNESLFSDNFLLNNLHFKHSVFYNTGFINGRMENIIFFSCTLEGTIFSNIEMENITFTDLNFDYSVFENVKMKNVILPFSQVCYSFGLLTYLKNTTDEVYITSVSNQKGYITKEEFLDLLPYFIKYYTDTKDYFPLANIYFYLEENEKAKLAILTGISAAVEEIDFRKIKYLCKLIYTYGVFNYHERQDIYNYIHSRISFNNMHSGLLYNYTVYKKEIEGYLLTNNRKDIVTVEINIKTNVFHDEANKLGILLSTIEEVIDLYQSSFGEHKIVCRHNSAEAILVIVQDLIPTAVAVITGLYSVLMGYFKLEEKRLRNQKLAVEIENLKCEQSKHELDMALKKMELLEKQNEWLESQNQIKKEILSKNISKNNIEIPEMSHFMFGTIPTQIDPLFIQSKHYKSKS